MIPPINTDAVHTAIYTTYTSPITHPSVPPAWDQTGACTSDFSFPMPMIPTIPQSDLLQMGPYHTYGPREATPNLHSTPPLDPYLSARYAAPLPLPPRAEPNITSSPRDRQPEIKPTSDRLEALKKAEEEAIRRRAQEQRDLELALQLDRQLNT
jgi:hypothetical protein